LYESPGSDVIGYIGADAEAAQAFPLLRAAKVSFLLGFPASSFTARAVEHHGDVLPHAARHADLLHSGKALDGNVFVLIPLSFLSTGVNDIVDAESDSLNRGKARLCSVRGPRPNSSWPLKWQIARSANPVS